MALLILLAALGFAYGVVLQRSGFCFARIGYEFFLLRRSEAFNGVAAGLAVATLGFAGVSAWRAQAGLSPTDHLLLLQFGPGTILGAVLFGIGMTVAGMCAVGTLLRIGEGYVVAWITLAGFMLGAALNPFSAFLPAAWRTPYRGVWLAERFGLPGAVLLTLVAIVLLWALLNRGVEKSKSREVGGKIRLLLLTPVAGGIALALLSTVQTAALEPWTVSGPLSLIPAALSGAVTHGVLRDMLPLIVVNIGLVLGAGASRAGREKRWTLRWPRRREQIISSLFGGVLMAWGLLLARGCNIGSVFSALPSLSLSGWLFFPSLILGTWVGAQVIKRIG